MCVAAVQPSEREAVRRAAPRRFRAGDQTCRLVRREVLIVFLQAQIARLQEAPQVAGGEIRFDPVAQSNQGPTRTCDRRGDTRSKCGRPMVAKRLLPDERRVRIGRARDFDVVQRGADAQNATEHFFDLGFAAAGMEEGNRRLAGKACGGGCRRHQIRQRVGGSVSWNVLDWLRARASRHRRRAHRERARNDPFAGHRVDEGALARVPMAAGKRRPAILRLNRTPVRMRQCFLVHRRHVRALVLVEKAVVGRKQGHELRLFRRR